MAYYPRFHVRNAYDTRIPTAISAMRHLFNLITLAEDENQKNNLVKAYDAVADQFLDMTKDIPEKNGIKTLGKDIKYFANGLVRSPEGAIIAKPFEYESFKGTTVTPKYNIFPKNRECGHYRYTRPTCTTSLLMKSYLKYKLTEKLTSGKLVKIPELYDKVQTLLNEFTLPLKLLTKSV